MNYREEYPGLEVLKGKTLLECYRTTGEDRWSGSEEIHFIADDGTKYKLYHSQDCCESVGIEDLNGDLTDLVGSPITFAEESSNQVQRNEYDSCTWTFYKFATVNGWVDIRWMGQSNGFYSEGVDFVRYE